MASLSGNENGAHVYTSRSGTQRHAGPPQTLDEWLRDPGGNVARDLHQAIRAGASPLFITGAAGTGKSTLLSLIAEQTPDAPVLAPTGVAALRAGGQTLHSFFRLERGFQRPGMDGVTRPTGLYRAISALIIDEVSMVRADVLDMVDWILKDARNCRKPFGGVPVMMFGDLLQLPPVVDRHDSLFHHAGYEGPHFFDAHVVTGRQLRSFVLDRVHRQHDGAFVHLLNAIRVGQAPPALLARLNRRVMSPRVIEGEGALILTTRRLPAEVINEQRLNALPGPERTYVGKMEGKFPARHVPAPIELRLRPGARVLFAKNDRDGRWVNGTIGVVVECRRNAVIVDRLDDRPLCTVERVAWERRSFKYKARTRAVERPVVGRFVQFPLVLGWAATIHRAQGITLDRVHVDLGDGAFAPGQTYVAISRVRTEEGLTLERPVRCSDVIVDPRAITFLESQMNLRAA